MNKIPGFDGYYANKEGMIFKGFKLIAQNIRKDGYLQCSIYNNKKARVNMLSHRLVLMAFENQENMQVNHKDGNKQNNNTSNLEWLTPSENSQHAYDTSLKLAPKGESNGRAKLTEKDVLFIRENKNIPSVILALKYGVSETAIARVRNRQSWKHI